MDDTEAKGMRREILDEVGAILREHLEAPEWGRVLIEVTRAEHPEPIVVGIEVEDIVGDESRIDAAFAPERVQPLLPVLAKATEALCELAGVDIDDVSGGTFLRQSGDDFEWLPGLVHAPSAAFERAADEAVRNLRAKRDELEERFALQGQERYEVDVEQESIVFSSTGRRQVRGRATLIGTYSLASRAWGWGGSNKSVPDRARAASAALVDGIIERDMWELSTPVFAVDEQTAWTLAAIVCDRAAGEGVYCSRMGGGLVFLLLRDVHEEQAS
jgi:hypothetical protein